MSLAILAVWGSGASLADAPVAYMENCGVCHLEGGVGVPGFAPPLTAEIWDRPGPTLDTYFATIVLKGDKSRILADGQTYEGMMPPHSHLSDQELADIARYLFGEVNGIETDLTPEAFAAYRNAARADTRALREELTQ